MRGIAYQDQIAAIKGGYQVRIQRPPKMCAREFGDAEQMRDRVAPITDEGCDKRLPRGGDIRRRRKTLGVKLNIPDDVLGINGQCFQSNATTDRLTLPATF